MASVTTPETNWEVSIRDVEKLGKSRKEFSEKEWEAVKELFLRRVRGLISRANPAAIRTERDEKIWKKAIRRAEKSVGYRKGDFTDTDWGLVMKIFQASKGKHSHGKLPEKYNPKEKTQSKIFRSPSDKTRWTMIKKAVQKERGYESTKLMKAEDLREVERRFFNHKEENKKLDKPREKTQIFDFSEIVGSVPNGDDALEVTQKTVNYGLQHEPTQDGSCIFVEFIDGGKKHRCNMAVFHKGAACVLPPDFADFFKAWSQSTIDPGNALKRINKMIEDEFKIQNCTKKISRQI